MKHVADEHKSSIVKTINNSEKKKENIPEAQEAEVECKMRMESLSVLDARK